MFSKKNKIKLTWFAAILSVLNSVLFHIPFFTYILDNVEKGFNGMLIFICMCILVPVANFFAFYLILYLGRAAGKAILSFFFIGNSVSLYFINTYDVLIDDTMMGNVFNTNTAEATSYYSGSTLLYILLLGVLPCILIWLAKVNYGSLKRFFANIGVSLLILIAIVFGNMSNWMWMDKNSTVAGSLVLPWSYVVNTFRYQNQQRELNRKEILLPDATFANNDKEALVLVIGESARRDHYSLYGYGRETNPYMAASENLTAFKADAAATYTTAGVKAILEPKDEKKLYEILPNYLFRTGADVIWRTSNWGQPPLHIDKYEEVPDISEKYGIPDEGHDGLLLAGLPELISGSDKDKVLIILHTSTSHGPSYYKKYPAEFEVFTPVCRTVEMSTSPVGELVNAYDNTVLYTDYLIHSIIEDLKSLPDWRTSMIFVSDHGESLGENNLYMHGVPISIAPAEQIEIPFIVWTSDGTPLKENDVLTQHHVFHSVLNFLSVDSPAYDESMNIFADE